MSAATAGRVRAYLGMSLDGRIAGPDDDLDWLQGAAARRTTQPLPDLPGYLGYESFTADIGALCMGRRTFDVVRALDPTVHGDPDLPVLVATHRPLPDGVPASVRAVAGSVDDVLDAALVAAGGRDVYVDGGRLVSAALDADRLDELVTTVLPTVRGPGVGLFDGLRGPHDLDLVAVATSPEGFVQLTWRPHGVVTD